MIPDVFVDSKDKCLSQINEVLKALSDKNQIADSECDDIINQSKLFREEVLNSDRSTEFSSFTITEEQSRLDTSWFKELSGSSHRALWNLIKTLLLLSHGQASVERGFSQNKEIMVDNMSEPTLRSLRAISDAITHAGGVTNIKVDKQMLIAVVGARQN